MEIELSALIAASLRALVMIMVPAAFGYFFGRIHAKYFMGKEDPHVDEAQREMVAILLFRRVALFLLVLWLLFGAFQIRESFDFNVAQWGLLYGVVQVCAQLIQCFALPVGICSGVDGKFVPPWRMFDWAYYVSPTQ